MVVVDSSVWIDLIRNRRTRQVEWLGGADPDDVLVADLVLFEVLKGARGDAHALHLAKGFNIYSTAHIGGERAAHRAAHHFRVLRSLGITIRRQIDLLLGSYCIEHGHELLYADRDFDQLAKHLNLRQAAGSLPPH